MQRAVILSQSGGLEEQDVYIPNKPIVLNHFNAFNLPNVKMWPIVSMDGGGGPPDQRDNRNVSAIMGVISDGTGNIRGKWAMIRIDGLPITIPLVNRMISVAYKGEKLYKYFAEWTFSGKPKMRDLVVAELDKTLSDTECTRRIKDAMGILTLK